MTDKNSFMRKLPKVDEVMRIIEAEKTDASTVVIKLVIQQKIEQERRRILSDSSYEFSHEDLLDQIRAEIDKQNRPHLKKVVNATGVILHTNLGRARLSQAVSQKLAEICGCYSNLEYDLESGERGSRYAHVEGLLKILTGAETALVVNNNAAAVFLILDSVVKGKEVIVSRGELVEIGGSFRVPDIMKASGCKLVEVGTTNKTHPADYEEQIGAETGAVLKVHTSNYKIIGFTEEVTLEQLKSIGIKHDLPVIYDLGSGLFYDLQEFGIGSEPTVKKCLEQQADLVCFSGDKLLGGPQAGIIAGSKKYIDMIKKNHLLRALRIDKLTLAALELTLREYLFPETVTDQNPTLKMIMEPLEKLRAKADQLDGLFIQRSGVSYEVIETSAQIGGGSMPGVNLPSYGICVKLKDRTADWLERKLRGHPVPIIARIMKDRVLLDVRTIETKEMEIVAAFFNDLNLKGDT